MKATKDSNVSQRGKRGVFYVRRRIPSSLLTAYPQGQTEIVRSLATADARQARPKAILALAAIEREFAAKRSQIDLSRASEHPDQSHSGENAWLRIGRPRKRPCSIRGLMLAQPSIPGTKPLRRARSTRRGHAGSNDFDKAKFRLIDLRDGDCATASPSRTHMRCSRARPP